MAIRSNVNAQLISIDSSKSKQLSEVIISGSSSKDAKILKNAIDEMDLPQSVSILNSKTLNQQQVANLSDILKNANGIYIMGNTGGYQEEIASRGYNISSTNTFKNGIRFFNGMKIETSGIDKIELLKGNSAIEYGNVAPGGVMNIVTKKPKFDFGGEVSMTFGSFQNFKPQFDIYGSLNKKQSIAFRLNASTQKTNSFRKYLHSESFYINPSLIFKISKKSTILLEGDFSKNTSVPDFGAGIINYQIQNIPRNRFTGVSWGTYKAQQGFGKINYHTILNQKWQMNGFVGFRSYSTTLTSNTRPSSTDVSIDGSWIRNIQKSDIKDNYLIQQLDLNSEFKTGKIRHQLLLGADAEQFETITTKYNNFNNYDTINIFEEYSNKNEREIPSLSKNTLTKNPVQRFGIYVQDLISISQKLKFFLGMRYNQIYSKTSTLTYSKLTLDKNTSTNKPFSPKIALIIQPNKNQTIFSSYSNSFILNSGIDINGKSIKPSNINQIEVGLKNLFLKNRIKLNLTLYQIVNSNLAQTSLLNGNTNQNIKELAGEVKGRGIEIDGETKLNNYFSILFGYSYNKTWYTKSNIYTIGSELRYNPKHTANASLNYTFQQGKLKKLNLGTICQYFGKRYAGRSTRSTIKDDKYKLIPLNSYCIIDITASYPFKKFTFCGKLSNILNEVNYNVHDDNSLNPITPINFVLQLKYNF